MGHRIGIDLGGTKIEVAVLDPAGAVALRRRADTPGTYDEVIRTIAALAEGAERELAVRATVGVGIPGVISPATGLVKNANSQILIGHALDQDLAAACAAPCGWRTTPTALRSARPRTAPGPGTIACSA